MFVPVTDLTRVCELILAGLCWYKWNTGALAPADTSYDKQCAQYISARTSEQFVRAVSRGKYGILTEE